MTPTYWACGYLTCEEVWITQSWTEMVAAVIDRYSMGQIDAAEAPGASRLALAIAVAVELQDEHPGLFVSIRPMDDPLWVWPSGGVVLDPRSDKCLMISLVRAGLLAAGRL